MEEEGGGVREGFNSSGVTVVGSDAGTEYHVAPRVDVSSSKVAAGSISAFSPPATGTSSSPATGMSSSPVTALSTAIVPFTKKRGRPRKYGPGGSYSGPLSPNPISSSVPPVIDFSSGKSAKPRGSSGRKIQQKFRLDNIGEWVAYSVGANFTPHIITVNTGEDVTMKVISFSQQGPRAICILSANGTISSVTLRQPDSSGGTLTYEGRFEILSLSGSFMPNENGGVRGRSGGMSVSLASPDGRILGGGVAGLLVAASPSQVVVGSFLVGNQKPAARKQKAESMPTVSATHSGEETEEGGFNGSRPQASMAAQHAHLSSFPSFRGDNWSSAAQAESRQEHA